MKVAGVFLLAFLGISQSQSAPVEGGLSVPQLIQTIDAPRHAAQLKAVFLHRRPGAELSVKQDWDQLLEACRSAPVGSKRWFLLNSIKATVTYRSQYAFVDPKEGAISYSLIFDYASKAEQSNSEYIVRSSVNEYVISLRGKIADTGHADDPDVVTTTVKAWQAYMISQDYQSSSAKRIARPDWITTFEIVGFPVALQPVIEKELNESKSPNYDLLSVAALVFEPQDPKRALSLLEEAGKYLPLDAHESDRYRERLSRLAKRSEGRP